MEDLSTLEVINLLTVGLSSLNMKSQVPMDIPVHGQFIDGSNLKSHGYLDQLDQWSENQKMRMNQKKAKAMIFNFTNNSQFTTKFQLKEENIEVVNQMKILGTIINKNLSWDENCQHLIKKVNACMQLLRSLKSFGASHEEMVHLWTVFCRSVLEQSIAVWHGSLTQENADDLERTQKSFANWFLRKNICHMTTHY